MTLAIGRRVIIVEGVERWRQADVETAPRCGALGADAAGHDARAVRARGGPREGAGGAARRRQARRRPGRRADDRQAVGARQVGARAGVALGLCAGRAPPPRRSSRRSASASSGCCASSRSSRSKVPARRGRSASRIVPRRGHRGAAPPHSAEWRAYGLADALVGARRPRGDALLPAPARAGRALVGPDLPDGAAAARCAGDRAAPAGGRVRGGDQARPAHAAAAAERFVADVARTDPERLRAALAALADLELDTRGGAPLASSRTALAGLDEDTLALRAIELITASQRR